MRPRQGQVHNIVRLQALPLVGLLGRDLLRCANHLDGFMHFVFVVQDEGNIVRPLIQFDRYVSQKKKTRLGEAGVVQAEAQIRDFEVSRRIAGGHISFSVS